MKAKIVQIDLLQPLPELNLPAEYSYFRLVLRIGVQPIAELNARPRGRVLRPRILLRRIARWRVKELMRALAAAAMRAGIGELPRPMRDLDSKQNPLHAREERWATWVDFARDCVLSVDGLQSPFRDWIEADDRKRAEREQTRRWPSVTVVVCTADRAAHVAECIESLKKLDYPDFEILIADNSREPFETSRAVERAGVRYLRVPERGLSFARNAAVEAAQSPWIAFTDDDCRPEPSWLRELIRTTFGKPNCLCVTGLVQPARLEDDAEFTFEAYGGLGRGVLPRRYTRGFLFDGEIQIAKTWDIGAGANMLIRRSAVRALGGFDVDLGAGRPAGCSEDTDIYYQILLHNRTIEYTPRAIVQHFHRCDSDGLRRQIHNYAKGHAAYHVRCFFRYSDHRSLLWLLFFLPKSILGRMYASLRGRSSFPLLLEYYELRGTFSGPWLYIGAKVMRSIKGVFNRAPNHPTPANPQPVNRRQPEMQ